MPEAGPPPEHEEAQRATWQAFVDNTFLAGVSSFDRRVSSFRAQAFARGMSKERAVEVVRECCNRYALETAELGSVARDMAVRGLVDSAARALQVHQRARRPHSKLLALRVRNEALVKLCRLLGVDEPQELEVKVTHGFDENLMRAAQETSDEEFARMLAEDRRRLPGVIDVEAEPGDNGRGRTKH
jgi:hypothetical protein